MIRENMNISIDQENYDFLGEVYRTESIRANDLINALICAFRDATPEQKESVYRLAVRSASEARRAGATQEADRKQKREDRGATAPLPAPKASG